MSVLAEALKDNQNEAAYLLDLDFDGWPIRIATHDVNVPNADGDAMRFRGTLAPPSFGFGFSFKSLRYSSPNVGLSCINDRRYQDLEAQRRLDNGTGKLYLWSPGADWTDLKPLFSGTFRREAYDSSVFRFSLIDFANIKQTELSSLSGTGHPADIAETVLNDYTTLESDEIGSASLETMKSILGPFWSFTTKVEAAIDSFDLFDRILINSLCGRIQRDGKVSAVAIDFAADPIGALSDRDFLAVSPVWTSTPFDLLCNDLLIKYNPGESDFDDSLTLDQDNNELCEKSVNEYGEQPQVSVELADVTQEATARLSGERYLDFFAFRHDFINTLAPFHSGVDAKEGDVFNLTLKNGGNAYGAGWTNERCALVSRRFAGFKGIKQTWLRLAA
jgi:hypothetical protein